MPGSSILWLSAMVLFLIVEAGTIALVSIWFAGGALLALIASLLGASMPVQITLFVLSSALLLALMWPLAKRQRSKKHARTNADRLLGQEVLVTEAIDNLKETGAIKVNGVLWTAKSSGGETISIGSLVRIDRIEGAKVYVTPVKTAAEISS